MSFEERVGRTEWGGGPKMRLVLEGHHPTSDVLQTVSGEPVCVCVCARARARVCVYTPDACHVNITRGPCTY